MLTRVNFRQRFAGFLRLASVFDIGITCMLLFFTMNSLDGNSDFWVFFEANFYQFPEGSVFEFLFLAIARALVLIGVSFVRKRLHFIARGMIGMFTVASSGFAIFKVWLMIDTELEILLSGASLILSLLMQFLVVSYDNLGISAVETHLGKTRSRRISVNGGDYQRVVDDGDGDDDDEDDFNALVGRKKPPKAKPVKRAVRKALIHDLDSNRGFDEESSRRRNEKQEEYGMLEDPTRELGNPWSDLVDEFLEEAFDAMNGFGDHAKDDWQLIADDTFGKFYKLFDDEIGIYSFKGVATLHGSPEQCIALATEMDQRKRWDDMFSFGEVVESYEVDNCCVSVVYIQNRPVFTLAARDVIALRCWKQLDDDTFLCFSQSVEHRDYPETDEFVRAKIQSPTGFLLNRREDGYTDIQSLTTLDFGGLIPQWLISLVVSAKPSTMIEKLNDCLDDDNLE